MVALYREARIVEDLVKSIDAFDYPQGKLDIKLVIEQRDLETLARIAELRLPARYEVVVAPSGKPQTKPRALNIALSCARGRIGRRLRRRRHTRSQSIASCRIAFCRRQKTGTVSRGVSRSGTTANPGCPNFSQLSTQYCSTLSIPACARSICRSPWAGLRITFESGPWRGPEPGTNGTSLRTQT